MAAAAAGFLEGVARAARFGRPPQARERIASLLGGDAGRHVVAALLSGAGGATPLDVVPRVADILGPLLHAPGWGGGAAAAWAHAALASIPMREGVPDEASRAALLRTIVETTDCAGGGAIQLSELSTLREALVEFARVCRRLRSKADIEYASFDWKT